MTANIRRDPVADAIDYFPLEHYQRPGIYRRRIRIATSPGQARADLEDDPHRYGVIVRHDGEHLTGVEGIADVGGCVGGNPHQRRLVRRTQRRHASVNLHAAEWCVLRVQANEVQLRV